MIEKERKDEDVFNQRGRQKVKYHSYALRYYDKEGLRPFVERSASGIII